MGKADLIVRLPHPISRIWTNTRRCAVGVALSLAVVGEAFGHGLGGVGVGVLVSDPDEAPLLVRLTTGLAIQTQPGIWQFICESQWGGVEDPQMVTAGGSFPVWVAGLDGLYEVNADGKARLVSPNTLTAGEVRAMSAQREGARAVALTLAATGSALWRLDGADGPTLWLVLSDAWTSIAATPSGITLGRLDPNGAFWALSLGWDAALETDAIPTQWMQGEPGGWIATLRATNDAFFMHSYDGFEYALWAVDIIKNETTKIAASAQGPIRGPVQVGASAWVLFEGRLGRIVGGQIILEDTELKVDCIGEHRESAFACVMPDLWKIGGQGFENVPWFEVAQVRAPAFDSLDLDTANQCRLDWEHFAQEAGIDPDITIPEIPPEQPQDDPLVTDVDPPERSAPADCACALPSGSSPSRPGLMVVLWVLFVVCGVLRRTPKRPPR